MECLVCRSSFETLFFLQFALHFHSKALRQQASMQIHSTFSEDCPHVHFTHFTCIFEAQKYYILNAVHTNINIFFCVKLDPEQIQKVQTCVNEFLQIAVFRFVMLDVNHSLLLENILLIRQYTECHFICFVSACFEQMVVNMIGKYTGKIILASISLNHNVHYKFMCTLLSILIGLKLLS